MSQQSPTPSGDSTWMGRAIELSTRGFPAPNPRVGCVLLNDGEIVGEGFHNHAGGPHAEAVALSSAGPRARGATAYVTLEPCNHHGRTPPCSEALVCAGVARVVYAVSDPNPVASGGARFLADHGIEVVQGVLAQEAAAVNRQFMLSHRLSRPYITLKSAVTLDGFIADTNGESKWITSEQARQDGHRLRAERGCVLVGRGTVQKDDPYLTAREVGAVNQPVRCVLDPRGIAPADSKVFDSQAESVWLVKAPRKERQTPWPGVTIDGALGVLHGLGVRGVLVEGGATTTRSFLESGLVDEIVLYVAGKTFGSGLTWNGGAGLLLGSLGLGLVETSQIGPDAKLVYRSDRDPGT